MILPALFAILVFLVLLVIVRPLLRGGTAAATGHDEAVYRDQLAELDRDISRGLITEAEAGSARLEIQRRLLAADRAATEATPGPSNGSSRVAALVVVVLVAGGSVVTYVTLPGPEVRTDRAAITDARRAELVQAAARLRDKLREEPGNAAGWVLYGRTMRALSAWDEVALAYGRALELDMQDSGTYAAYGEALVAQAQGDVTQAARDAFQAALRLDPGDAMARYYMAVATAQAGDPASAIAKLQELASELPEQSGERAEVLRRVDAIARQAGIDPTSTQTPTSPDGEAARAAATLSPAERKAMIEAMVARLAERLEREPNDLEGWMRLGQSWSVLGDATRAADAYDRAWALRPGDLSIPLQALEVLLRGLSVRDPIPPRALALVRRIEEKEPNEPAVLWYLGLEAARQGKRDEARNLWQRLLNALPDDNPDKPMVKAAIGALTD